MLGFERRKTLKKTLFMTMIALGVAAFVLMAQDGSKFNGTWKGDGGQVRKLTFKEGVVYMEETQTNGSLILRNYPTQGQEITMTEGVWKDSKATGKMTGNKLVVDTTMPNGTKWHDEWTLADDGKTYAALRQLVAQGEGGAFGKGGGGGKGPGGGAPGGGGPGGGKGPGGGGGAGKGRGANEPETFTKIQ
jgi:cell division protein FtsW (lipid II flippase)